VEAPEVVKIEHLPPGGVHDIELLFQEEGPNLSLSQLHPTEKMFGFLNFPCLKFILSSLI
jgi:hypothetical protein